MTRDPIRQAIESGDLCEVGRLYAKQLAEMESPTPPHPTPRRLPQPQPKGAAWGLPTTDRERRNRSPHPY